MLPPLYTMRCENQPAAQSARPRRSNRNAGTCVDDRGHTRPAVPVAAAAGSVAAALGSSSRSAGTCTGVCARTAVLGSRLVAITRLAQSFIANSSRSR